MIFDQYKKTFWRMKSVMLLAALLIWAVSHSRDLAGLFYVVMQGSAFIGASWAVRLKPKVARAAGITLSRV